MLRSILERVRAQPSLKVALTLGLPVILCGPYFALQRVVGSVSVVMPQTALDRAIPYREEWIWVYLSLYMLMFVPVFSTSASALRRYGTGFVVVCLASHAVFLLWPTEVAYSGPALWDPGMAMVLAIDGQRNACPSLHASLAMYTACCVPSLFSEARHVRAISVLSVLWALAIAASTLPTRRHVVVDLVAGLAVALVSFWLTRARARAPGAEVAPNRQSTAAARAMVQAGREAEIARLRVLDWRNRAGEIAVFVATWAAGGAIALAGSPREGALGWALLVVGTGLSAVALNAFVLLLHEGMHNTLFGDRRANRWCSVAFGTLVLMSFSAYRVMHTRHHDYLGDDRDPDDYHNYTTRRWLVWCLHYVRLLAGTFLYIGLIPILAFRHADREARRAICVEYAILVVAATLAAMTIPPHILVTVWLVPVVVVAYFTSVRGFTQHGITVADDPYLASRSIASPRIVAFCLLNENFHLEHHLFPEVPSYNLRRLHELIADRVPYRVTGTSYLGFVASFLRATVAGDERPIGLRVTSDERRGL